MKVYAGDFDPPGDDYTSSDMNGDGIIVNWYCDDYYACYNSFLSCKGDGIANCFMDAASSLGSDAIIGSTVECNIPNEQCGLNCFNGCKWTNLLCHGNSTGAQCDCRNCASGVTIINDATYQPTTSAPSTITPTNVPTMPTDSPTPSPLNAENTNYLTSWYQPHQPVHPSTYSRTAVGFDATRNIIWLIGM